MKTLKPKRFLVYAIRLDPSVLSKKRFREANPHVSEAAECFYVGMTGRTREERFAQHKAGYKACRFVKEFGVELMPDRSTHCNPKTYEEAQRFERTIAGRLRREGHAVWQR